MKQRTKRFTILLAALALAVAGCDGDGDGVEADGEPVVAGPGTVSVIGTDDLKWSETELRAGPGELTVGLTCEPAIDHNFVIAELEDELVVACEPGEAATGTVDLDPGSYTFYCNIAGHRSAGMEGTLVVEG